MPDPLVRRAIARAHCQYASLAAVIAWPATIVLAADEGASLDEAPPPPQEMETDRPDFTEGTQTVAPGRVQLEAGYTFTFNDDRAVKSESHVLPEALVRVGVVESVELRLGWEGYQWLTTDGTSGDLRGAIDSEVGFKIHALDQAGFVPNFALIGSFSLPTGDDEITADQVDPALILASAYDLTERLSIGANVGLAGVSNDDGDRFLETSASVALGASITDWAGTYVEYYGIFPDDPGREDEHVVNGGFTFPVTPDLQFDVRAGAGLNDAADDYFLGAGLAIRF